MTAAYGMGDHILVFSGSPLAAISMGRVIKVLCSKRQHWYTPVAGRTILKALPKYVYTGHQEILHTLWKANGPEGFTYPRCALTGSAPVTSNKKLARVRLRLGIIIA